MIAHPRKYYQPRYLPTDIRLDNERTTVHWEPNIVTNEHGKATVTFFTSDAKGTYSLNLQGADFAGKFGNNFKTLTIR
ncbi:MAG: hypothetical protein EOO92_20260 [Pedobacter sp.]|nr:MAG: hypothetical protein EOO92_20260 [Pedobacter sp.]